MPAAALCCASTAARDRKQPMPLRLLSTCLLLIPDSPALPLAPSLWLQPIFGSSAALTPASLPLV